VLIVTAPPEVEPEPLESVVRVGGGSADPPPSMLAATAEVAVLVSEDLDGGVTFHFVDSANQAIAEWNSERGRAPRLVCAGCPRPVVGDTSGYFAWDGSVWQPEEVPGVQTSSLADPLTTSFGVMHESADRVSRALVVGRDGRYLLVRDGGTDLELVPTGITPSAGDQVDLRGGPGRTIAPLALSVDPSGAVVSVQSDPISVGAPAHVVRVDGHSTRSATLPTGHGLATANTAVCRRVTAAAPLAVALSVQPLARDEPPPEPRVAVVWLDGALEEVGRVELAGFHDHCLSLPDGSVRLWTGTTAGIAAVDVASVRTDRIDFVDTVEVGTDTLVNTLSMRNDTGGTLVSWPLGQPPVRISEDLATVRFDGIGGSQVLQDDLGGTWVWYGAVRTVARVPPEPGA
jgi:hypothetical protein